MRIYAIALGALLLGCCGLAARADENQDLNLIPGTLDQTPAPAASASAATASIKIYLEDAAAVESLRAPLAVPLPPSTSPELEWQNRTSLDAAGKWRLADDLDGVLSDRANLFYENDIRFPAHADLRNDFREGYLTWEPVTQNYVEAGRINLKHGVALGYNPTDYFKTRSAVAQASADPSVTRSDRLGVVAAQAQSIFAGGSVTLAAAPKLQSTSAIPLTAPPPSFDPGFGQTNGADRFLLAGSYEIADGVSPEVLVYHEPDTTRFGANLSRTIGQSIVAYGEWSGGNQAGLVSRAIAFGKDTGVLPAAVTDTSPGKHFANDAAAGASWTSGADKVTLNVEYHYHQTGFDRAGWRGWFALSKSGVAGIDGLLWYERSFASDQQEPMSRQQIFLRADWTDAFIPHLELSAFAFVNVYDGSTMTQLSASYDLSDAWTVGALVGANLGASHSEWGSSPDAASAILRAVKYF